MNPGPHQPGERRPIASRERRSSQLVAHWLASRGVSPNAISVTGMVCAIVAGGLFASTSLWPGVQRFAWILGAGLVQLRLMANMFDGMVAIASQKTSPVGELYNEVPDRISDAAVFIGLGYAAGGMAVLGYAATCTAIFTAYVRSMGKVAGARQEFCGPMAKQHRMFLVTMLGLYSALTPAAWQPARAPETWGAASWVLAVIIAGALLTAARRLWRVAAALKKNSP